MDWLNFRYDKMVKNVEMGANFYKELGKSKKLETSQEIVFKKE